MSIVKKITIISLFCALLVTTLIVPSSAQWIADNVEQTTYENALLAPNLVRYVANEYDGDGNTIGRYGNVFAMQPVLNLDYSNVNSTSTWQQTTYLDTPPVAGVPAPYNSNFRRIALRVTTYASGEQMQARCFLSNLSADSYESTVTSTHLGFPTFTCTKVGAENWTLKLPKEETNPNAYFGLQCTYYTKNPEGLFEAVNLEAEYLEEFETSYSSDVRLVRMTEILEHIEFYSEQLGKPLAYDDQGRTTIENLTIYLPPTSRGNFEISTANGYFPTVTYASTGVTNTVVSYADFNLLTWIGESLGAIFDATLFQLGETRVTLGGALAVPLSLMFFIAFLKKFAGG